MFNKYVFMYVLCMPLANFSVYEKGGCCFCLRALDSISLLRYVVTTQMQFDFRFSSSARSVRRPNFTLGIVFSFESFSKHENVFCSKKQNS